MAHTVLKFLATAGSGSACAIGQVASFDDESGALLIACGEVSDAPFEADCLRGAFDGARPESGEQVLVLFPSGDARPVVVGCVGIARKALAAEDAVTVARAPRPTVAHVDGREVRLSAKTQITLQCGEASITLTRDGKVTIRGAQVVSRAAGVNKVKGGSVQIN